MPLTRLDTSAALVVIDLQKGIVGLPTVHPAGEIIGRTAQLARAFRERGLPVVLVNVTSALPAVPTPEPPSFRFRQTGPNLSLSWSSTPKITLSANNDGARSLAHRWMSTCASAASLRFS